MIEHFCLHCSTMCLCYHNVQHNTIINAFIIIRICIANFLHCTVQGLLQPHIPGRNMGVCDASWFETVLSGMLKFAQFHSKFVSFLPAMFLLLMQLHGSLPLVEIPDIPFRILLPHRHCYRQQATRCVAAEQFPKPTPSLAFILE